MATKLEGDGEYAWEVKGESRHFAVLGNLWRKAGGSKKQQTVDVQAELAPEPRNPADRNAVAVLINGSKVGYLSREEAATYAAHMKGKRATCPAQITSFSGDIFSVALDLPDDWEPEDEDEAEAAAVPIPPAKKSRSCLVRGLMVLIVLCLLFAVLGALQAGLEAIIGTPAPTPTGALLIFPA